MGIDARTAITAAIALLILTAGVLIFGGSRAEQVPLPDRQAIPHAASDEPPRDVPAGQPTDAPREPTVDVEPATVVPIVVVHVVGEVVSPGLVELLPGARVADALEAAGGTTTEADLAALNLAREVVDGEQVRVPAPGDLLPNLQDEVSGPAGPGQVLVNINTANASALEELPGVGPVLAARIVGHRDDNGPFASVDDLVEVSGIGQAVLDGLRDAATT